MDVTATSPYVTQASATKSRVRQTDLRSRGEPFVWVLGGTLVFGIVMIVGFLVLVAWNGIATFIPEPIAVVTTTNGTVIAGEPSRTDVFKPDDNTLGALSPDVRAAISQNGGLAGRTLYRVGNFDLYGEDFRWVTDFDVKTVSYPKDMVYVERLEWGPFIGAVKAITIENQVIDGLKLDDAQFVKAHDEARARWARIHEIERNEIGAVNAKVDRARLSVRKAELDSGRDSPAYEHAEAQFEQVSADSHSAYDRLTAEVQELRAINDRSSVTFVDIGGREKAVPLASIVRAYAANDLGPLEKVGVYLSRWGEFLADEPREANTEGGVFPAIFGTLAMTLLMVVAVAPFGVITALYLREYAKQGRLVSFVRISVNNLAGVPSIVYGVFGLGFFAYVLGGSIDRLFYSENLPNPTFGTGGLLWAALTLALLTVPVVIVATEEALAAVPRSMREGSLACGASKWQTIRNIVLPRALPGVMTGIILAMARGAGEVAPLMLVGVVKLAPNLPVDGIFPYVHLERSFMHLGFHIFDVGFQSRNSEAGKPMVFVTTVLLITLVAVMNAVAIVVRNRLKRRFVGSQF
ncbi:MAG: phosphate ABC transporter permease PstA [Rhodospirillaceae bacterium]|nr:MAG: phosphate ABC transporter permease PstA [Rhodospirillaceae bacterium]